MKTLFIISLICALMSLVAIVASSAITFAPGAESERNLMMFVAAAFLVGWIWLAFWVRRRQRTATLPHWITRSLVFAGVVYMLGILLFVVG
jgi:uncharacterized membrane protein YhdT